MTLLQRCLGRLLQQTQSATISNAIRKSRKRDVATSANYQSLEPRKLLASLTVDTLVDVTGPADLNDGFISLREAITAANTNAAFGDAPAGDATGDSINFDSSLTDRTLTLNGSELTIEDDLVIRGGNTNLTLSGDDASRIFRINSAENVVLSRLNFTEGRSLTEGGALLVEGGGTVRLFQSHFSSNNAGDGGAVYNRGGRLLISGSSFTDNNADGEGGGLYSEGGLANFSNATFSGNSSGVAGGAISADGGQYFFFESTVNQNSAGGIGGGIYVGGVDTTALLLASNISENSSDDGGGIFLEADNRVSIFGDSSVSDNIASTGGRFSTEGDGGGIYSRGGIVRIGGSQVSGNSAIIKGGGIYSDGGILNVSNTQIVENQTQDDGGGVAVEGTLLILKGATFRSNSAIGVRNIAEQNSSGGGLFIGASDTPSTASILGSTFQFNSSHDIGGAIYNAGTNTTIGSSFIGGNEALGREQVASGGGGGIFNEGDKLTINSTTIQNNSTSTFEFAGRGGGLFSREAVRSLGNRGILEINFSSFLRNHAQEAGGGIAIAGGEARLFQTNVGNLEGDGNRAGDLPDYERTRFDASNSEGVGGGIFAANTKLTIFGGVIGNNIANDFAGGLYSFNSEVIFRAAQGQDSTMVVANRALMTDGGGVFASGGNLRLRDSVFENNTSRDGGGLYVNGPARLNLDGSEVRSNDARRSGGGLYLDEGIVIDLENVTIEFNTAPFGPDVFEA